MSTKLTESIVGRDDRMQITATSTYPWRVHASLLITAADGLRVACLLASMGTVGDCYD